MLKSEHAQLPHLLIAFTSICMVRGGSIREFLRYLCCAVKNAITIFDQSLFTKQHVDFAWTSMFGKSFFQSIEIQVCPIALLLNNGVTKSIEEFFSKLRRETVLLLISFYSFFVVFLT